MTTLLILFITKRQFERRKKETNDREKFSLKIAIPNLRLTIFQETFFWCIASHAISKSNHFSKPHIVYNLYAHRRKNRNLQNCAKQPPMAASAFNRRPFLLWVLL
jgi:hypothetical protein